MKRSRGGLALLLIACGTGDVSVPVNENSGVEAKTRLRAKVWTADDASLFRWFYDSKRKEDCAFIDGAISHTGPGPTYWCLPRDSVMHDATGGLAIFADKRCQAPLALAVAQERIAYVIVRSANSCAEPLRVYRAGPVETTKPWVFDGTACVPSSLAVATVALGEEVPLESFVSAVETVTPVGASIARLELVGSDGSRQTMGGYDPGRRFAVSPGDPGGLGDRRWFPSRLAFEGAGTILYGDSACKAAVPTKVARDAICPLGASFLFAGTCGEGDYYALGDAIDTATLFEKTPLGTCVAANERGVVAYRRSPSPIPRSAFAAAETVDVGAGRIRLRAWSDASKKSAIAPASLFDAQLAEVCTPEVAADGETRCLPGDSVAVTLWADASCTQPAYEEPSNGCQPPPAPKWVRSSGHAYRVKGSATELYEKRGKTCELHEAGADSRRFAVEHVEPAQFAVLNEVTR